MDLTRDDDNAEHLSACAGLMGRRACAHQVREGADLVAVWRRLQQAQALQLCVLKDRERPAGKRVVAFGMSVFVSDAFVRAARAESAVRERFVVCGRGARRDGGAGAEKSARGQRAMRAEPARAAPRLGRSEPKRRRDAPGARRHHGGLFRGPPGLPDQGNPGRRLGRRGARMGTRGRILDANGVRCVLSSAFAAGSAGR